MKINVATLMCVAVFLGVAVLVYNHIKAVRSENAIIGFYTQLTAIQKEFKPKFEAEMGQSLTSSDPNLYRSFYLRLNSMNVSECPPDFIQNWAECLKVERVIADDYAADRGWVNFLVGIAELKDLKASDWEHASKLKNARESAYTELKASAIRHGIKFSN